MSLVPLKPPDFVVLQKKRPHPGASGEFFMIPGVRGGQSTKIAFLTSDISDKTEVFKPYKYEISRQKEYFTR